MNKTIIDDSFLKKLLYKKYKSNFVYYRECNLERLSFVKKVEYAVSKLSILPFNKARLIINYWEDIKQIIPIFEKHKIHNYQIQREYKGKSISGTINVYFDKGEFNEGFIREIITKHYGYELGKKDIVDVCLYYAIETEKEVTIIHLYDDRGFREYTYVF